MHSNAHPYCLFIGISQQPMLWFNASVPCNARTLASHETLLEIDNFSEEQTLHYAVRFAEEAPWLCTIVQIIDSTGATLALQPLLRRIMKRKHLVSLWQVGHHAFIERIGNALPPSHYQKFDSETALLSNLPTLLRNFPS